MKLNTEKERLEYAKTLRAYRDFAASHPTMIGELRDVLAKSNVSAPPNSLLARRYRELIVDIDAYLHAIQSGEIDVARRDDD